MREQRQTAVISTVQNAEEKKKKSLPGFLAKYRHEIDVWLHHYMILFCKAEDEQISYFKEMTREQRNKAIQEYVDVSEFKSMLEAYLKEEELNKKE